MERFFFDTYALIEIVKGNPKYETYRSAEVVITIFNLAEFHFAMLRDFSQLVADSLAEKYAPYVVDTSLNIIKKANVLKYEYRKRKFSAPDAIGYLTAQELGIPFLTGDEDFRDMSGVEFVKK